MPPKTLPAEVSKHVEAVIRIVRKYLPKETHSILLYGSWARAEALPHSDIDVAISGPTQIDYLTLARIREELDDLPTLRKVDLVDLPSVGETLRRAILETHIALE